MVGSLGASPYEVLGVARGAPDVVVRRAYRRLALQHHPDKDAAEDATANFQQIQEAYEVLITPESRRQCDADLDVTAEDLTPLMGACMSGDVAEVERLIDEGVDVNAQNALGLMAVHYAVGAGSDAFPAGGTRAIPLLRALFEAGVPIDAESRDGFTALSFASVFGYVPVVSFLVRRGATVDAGIAQAPTALSLAAEQGHLAVVRMLLENEADPNVKGGDSVSALAASIKYGHSDVAASLLWADADPNLQGWDNKSPLLVAAERFADGAPGALLLCELLLHSKADAQGAWGDPRTPLSVAAQQNSFRLSDMLINSLQSQASDRYWDKSNEARKPPSLCAHLCLPITTECAACFAGLSNFLGRQSNAAAKEVQKSTDAGNDDKAKGG